MRKFLIRVTVTEDMVPTIVGLLTSEVEELTVVPLDLVVEVKAPVVKSKHVRRKSESSITEKVLRAGLTEGLHGDRDLMDYFTRHHLSPASVSPAVSIAIKKGWAVRGPGGVFLVKTQ